VEISWTAGPVLALAVLLGVAGVVKLGRPASAITALTAAKLPAPEIGVRALGLVEVGIAIALVTVGSAFTALFLAIVYAGFALFMLRLVRLADATVSCGCFGEVDAPASMVHVVVNAIAASIALAGVAVPPGPVVEILSSDVVEGGWFLLLVVLLATVVYAALALLPELLDAIGVAVDDSGRAADRRPS